MNKNIKISIFVECQKVGRGQNYFGKIQIQEKQFYYNFSILKPVENFKRRTVGEYLKFLKSVDFILFDCNNEIDLNKKEFSFFVSLVVMSLIMTLDELYFVIHFFLEIPQQKANLLNRRKFNCQINN